MRRRWSRINRHCILWQSAPSQTTFPNQKQIMRLYKSVVSATYAGISCTRVTLESLVVIGVKLAWSR